MLNKISKPLIFIFASIIAILCCLYPAYSIYKVNFWIFELNPFIKNTPFNINIYLFFGSLIYLVLYFSIGFFHLNKEVKKEIGKLNSAIKKYYKLNNIPNPPNTVNKSSFKEITAKEKTLVKDTNIYQTKDIEFITYNSDFQTEQNETLILYIKRYGEDYKVFGDNSTKSFDNRFCEAHTEKFGSVF